MMRVARKMTKEDVEEWRYRQLVLNVVDSCMMIITNLSRLVPESAMKKNRGRDKTLLRAVIKKLQSIEEAM